VPGRRKAVEQKKRGAFPVIFETQADLSKLNAIGQQLSNLKPGTVGV
jgi:hypothetical protein